MTIPKQAIDLIASFEGFRAKPYNDGVGIATIGYGTTVYPSGIKVKLTDKPIAEAIARQYMQGDLLMRWTRLSKTIPYWAEMNANQRSALLSFAYNLGIGFYGSPGFNSITQALKVKNWAAIPDVLLKYRNPGSAVEAGLKRRRIAEGDLWKKKP